MQFKRDEKYQGSTFKEVRDQVFSDPYESLPKLPVTKITVFRMFKPFKNLLKAAAKRTMREEGDILPHFNKLIHSNGVGYSGTWNVTEDNPYTGLFKQGTKVLMVARASCILTETTKGAHRGFGFAGKIFPTSDPNEKVKTANLLLLNSFVGTPDRYFSDVEISNNPVIGFGWNLAKYFGVLATTLFSFPWADSHLTYRSLYQLARVGVDEDEIVKSPTWLMVKARDNRLQDFDDFRREIVVENRNDGRFILDVFTSESTNKKDRQWQPLGYIDLDESIMSESTDHRLHFHHMKLRGSGIKGIPRGI